MGHRLETTACAPSACAMIISLTAGYALALICVVVYVPPMFWQSGVCELAAIAAQSHAPVYIGLEQSLGAGRSNTQANCRSALWESHSRPLIGSQSSAAPGGQFDALTTPGGRLPAVRGDRKS